MIDDQELMTFCEGSRRGGARRWWGMVLGMLATAAMTTAGGLALGPVEPGNDDAAKHTGSRDKGEETQLFREQFRVDDGHPETGYGFVPSAKWGEVVQRFDFGSERRTVTELCSCWLKKQGDAEVDFELRAYPDVAGRPGNEPLWTGNARVNVEAREKSEMGAVDCVGVTGLAVEGGVFLGMRWDPGVERFAFVCADHTEGTPLVPGFHRDDRAKGWTANEASRDPNFLGHRSLVLWPVVGTAPATLEPSSSSAPSPLLADDSD